VGRVGKGIPGCKQRHRHKNIHATDSLGKVLWGLNAEGLQSQTWEYEFYLESKKKSQRNFEGQKALGKWMSRRRRGGRISFEMATIIQLQITDGQGEGGSYRNGKEIILLLWKTPWDSMGKDLLGAKERMESVFQYCTLTRVYPDTISLFF
jgi:hypothetical protein